MSGPCIKILATYRYPPVDGPDIFKQVLCRGFNLRFVVTSLPARQVPPSQLYTQQYCPRGEMENRFKEQQLELFSDRTSTHTNQCNQLRLWFSSLADRADTRITGKLSCDHRTGLCPGRNHTHQIAQTWGTSPH